MNIVIAGAGKIGRYVAETLSNEEYNVILVDMDEDKLNRAAANLDIATRSGSATDWQLLDELLDLTPSCYIALTNDDNTNLVSCALAKHLGYPRTIARVSSNKYINKTRLDFSHIFEVDTLISPELLQANEIIKYLSNLGALSIENFIHGAVQLRRILIPDTWKQSTTPLAELNLPRGINVALIRRDSEQNIIFPHGLDCIQPKDEVTFIGETDAMNELPRFLDLETPKVESIVILGGTVTGINLAQQLDKRGTPFRIIEEDYEQCRRLADLLPDTTILNNDGKDIDFLRSEKIGNADLFVACTENDETNLIAAIQAKEVGCKETIVTFSQADYSKIAAQFNINHLVSSRSVTADHILSQLLSETVNSLQSLYENQAEIIEVKVSSDSKLVGIPLSQLGPLLPRDFLIAVIQNRGRIMAAKGDCIISPGDTVLVITNPRHIPELETMF